MLYSLQVSSPKQTAMLIVWGQPKFPSTFSDHAKDFICQALQKDPEKRPAMVELLHHPWIAQHQTADLPPPAWLQHRASFNGMDNAEAPVIEPRKSAPLGALQYAATAITSSAHGTKSTAKRGVRRAVTVRDLAPKVAAPIAKFSQRKPVARDRTFNVGISASLPRGATRSGRRNNFPRTSTGSACSVETGNTVRASSKPPPPPPPWRPPATTK